MTQRDSPADAVGQYDVLVFDGKWPTKLWCLVRGHFWNYTEVNMFGTPDVDCIECNRCAELRLTGADDD